LTPGYQNAGLLALVRRLPCANCGRHGTQAAHSNLAKHGKGKSIKASDAATFPLCPDCHRDFDQGGLLSHDEAEQLTDQWINQTHIQLIELGLLKPA
jgi:hypothetical protein